MASVRKRKMARSSVKKNTVKNKDKKRKLNFIPHPVMAAHWDKKLTWKQNYERFGLQANLGKKINASKPKNEISKPLITEHDDDEQPSVNPEQVANETDPEKIPLGEARIIRDPVTNEVIEIIYGKMEVAEELSQEPAVPIIDELKEYQEKHAKPAFKAELNEIECHWMAGLSKKYGDNYARMKWDQKLNPMFYSEGQLKKMMTKWKNMTEESH